MNKEIIPIGIVIIFVVVGFSGCNDTNADITISSFNVNPSQISVGDTANLSWSVNGANSVTIDNGIGSVSNTGTRIIMPDDTTIYILTATSDSKTITATTQIIVAETSEEEDEVETAPEIQFVKDDINDKLTVAKVSPSNIYWSDIEITPSNGFNWEDIQANGFTFNSSTDKIYAGDYIEVGTGQGTVSLRHVQTNTLLGVWEFN